MKKFNFRSVAALVFAARMMAAEGDPATNTVKVSGAPDLVATGIMEKPIYRVGIHAVSFSPDGQTLAAGDGTGHLRLWDAESGELKQDVAAHSNWVFAIHWTGDGKIITGGGDNLIHWFDAKNPSAPERTLAAHSNDVHAVVLRSNGKTLYSAGDDRQIVFWDVKEDEAKKRILGHQRQIPALALSPNEKLLASGSRDDTIRLWDAKSGKLKDVLIGHTGDVMALSFSPDGRLLASAGWDNTVRLWDAKKGKAVRIFGGHPTRVSGVAFSPDGRTVVSSSGPSLRMFDAESGKQIWNAQFTAKIESTEGKETAEDLSAVAFRPDGKMIAVGSTTGAVYLVEADSGEVLRTVRAEAAADGKRE